MEQRPIAVPNIRRRGTERRRRTRQNLLDAARLIFERVGYFDAKIDEIVSEAQVARGSFYTYFPDKLHVFRILAGEVSQTVEDAVVVGPTAAEFDVVRPLDQSN